MQKGRGRGRSCFWSHHLPAAAPQQQVDVSSPSPTALSPLPFIQEKPPGGHSRAPDPSTTGFIHAGASTVCSPLSPANTAASTHPPPSPGIQLPHHSCSFWLPEARATCVWLCRVPGSKFSGGPRGVTSFSRARALHSHHPTPGVFPPHTINSRNKLHYAEYIYG